MIGGSSDIGIDDTVVVHEANAACSGGTQGNYIWELKGSAVNGDTASSIVPVDSNPCAMQPVPEPSGLVSVLTGGAAFCIIAHAGAVFRRRRRPVSAVLAAGFGAQLAGEARVAFSKRRQ